MPHKCIYDGSDLEPRNADATQKVARFVCLKCDYVRLQPKRQPGLKTVKLDKWEQQKVLGFVTNQYLTFLSHYTRAGLFDHEVDEANRLGALMHKLGPSREPHAPLAYLGILPSGRKSDGS